jgi:hypothetical protein
MSEHAINPTTGVQISPRTTIKVHLKGNVDLPAISNIIAGIGGRYGCRTCGLMGFDLQLSGDPGDFTEFASLPGVKSVGV